MSYKELLFLGTPILFSIDYWPVIILRDDHVDLLNLAITSISRKYVQDRVL